MDVVKWHLQSTEPQMSLQQPIAILSYPAEYSQSVAGKEASQIYVKFEVFTAVTMKNGVF
jgi:hypothetical protein